MHPLRHFTKSLCAVPVAMLAVSAFAQSVPAAPAPKTESFDHDPQWESFRSRMEMKERKTISQDFGYSADTAHAGGKPGEIGGKVTRTSRAAWYAVKLPERTLNDRFSASGAFTLTATSPGGGVFVGLFHDQQGETARPINSLGMNIDTEGSGARMAVRLINAHNESCGHFVTHFIPGKFRPTPLRKGVRYEWTLSYDPDAAGGNGQFIYTLSGHDPQKDPIDGRIAVDLPSGFKQTNARFNRFGLMNMRKSGGTASIYLDDLAFDQQRWDFAADPHWEEVGNRDSYLDPDPAGVQNFGYSNTQYAGGNAGEIGGVIWRSNYASYGDHVGPFTLNQPLTARGHVAFTAADPDSDVYIGWFSSTARDEKPGEYRNFVGVAVGGPTRVGHFFAPALWTGKGEKAHVDRAPVLRPDGKSHEWTLSYDPGANGGLGAVTVTLDRESATLKLREKVKSHDATLDRFGLFSSRIGGSKVKIWLDDLQYSAKPAPR